MRKRSRDEQVEANRAAVLAAARHVFLAKGYAGATLERIAEEAKFSKGVVFSQFTGKADLFLALLDARIEERAAENERLVADATGAAALWLLMENFDRDSRAETGWARVLTEFRAAALRDPGLNRRYAECHERSVALLADLLERAGVAGSTSASPSAMAEFLMVFGAGLTLERAVAPDTLPLPDAAQMVLRALGFEPVESTAVSGEVGR